MKFTILTDVGVKRTSNQDFADVFTSKTGEKLFILADGMGGHKAGNVASQLAVQDLGKLWQEKEINPESAELDITNWLTEKVSKENQNIADLGNLDEYKGMGTTLEAVVIYKNKLISAHVGDSKTQIIRDSQIIPVTKDHSLVQELVDAGELTEEEAINHPNKNIVTKSLGQQTFLEPDVEVVKLKKNDYILMNSDGLTNMVDPEQIVAVIDNQTMTIEIKGQTLIELANENGGLDNITLILLTFDKEKD